MKISDIWWSSPQEAESGRKVIITARDGMQPIIDGGKYTYRVEVNWQYDAQPDGFPSKTDAETMEQATDRLAETFRKDPVAVMTGIYTGDGERNWIFYTKSLRIFGMLFNKALEPLDTIPLTIEAYEDPEWEQYRQIKDETYIPPED